MSEPGLSRGDRNVTSEISRRLSSGSLSTISKAPSLPLNTSTHTDAPPPHNGSGKTDRQDHGVTHDTHGYTPPTDGPHQRHQRSTIIGALAHYSVQSNKKTLCIRWAVLQHQTTTHGARILTIFFVNLTSPRSLPEHWVPSGCQQHPSEPLLLD